MPHMQNDKILTRFQQKQEIQNKNNQLQTISSNIPKNVTI